MKKIREQNSIVFFLRFFFFPFHFVARCIFVDLPRYGALLSKRSWYSIQHWTDWHLVALWKKNNIYKAKNMAKWLCTYKNGNNSHSSNSHNSISAFRIHIAYNITDGKTMGDHFNDHFNVLNHYIRVLSVLFLLLIHLISFLIAFYSVCLRHFILFIYSNANNWTEKHIKRKKE